MGKAVRGVTFASEQQGKGGSGGKEGIEEKYQTYVKRSELDTKSREKGKSPGKADRRQEAGTMS